MTVADRVAAALARFAPRRVLVAASGGVDSTLLLHLLVKAGADVVAAHVDHGLRPGSADDGAFVGEVAAALGVPCVQLAVAVVEGNVQAAARDARYAALLDTARANACDAVATGHTATDQAETVLLALARGAGLRGLAGMLERRALGEGVVLIRPLLQSTRAEVEAAARERGVGWREDPSNDTDAFARNRLRHNVLPALRDEGGDAVDRRIAASADAARAALGLIQATLDGLAPAPGRLALGVADLDPDVRDAVLAEALARWLPDAARSRALVDRLAALLDAPVGQRVESGGATVWRERDGLRFALPNAVPLGALVATALDAVPEAFSADPLVEIVDADAVAGWRVRAWRPGDRIAPLGMSGSRLVADVLREGGVSAADREAAPVVVVGDRVAWVVGLRLAAWASVSAKTRCAARWSWRAGAGAG